MDELSEIIGCEIGQHYSQALQWYLAEPLVIEVAKKHPSVMIEVDGNGEEYMDNWSARYLGERSELCQAFIPPFVDLVVEED